MKLRTENINEPKGRRNVMLTSEHYKLVWYETFILKMAGSNKFCWIKVILYIKEMLQYKVCIALISKF